MPRIRARTSCRPAARCSALREPQGPGVRVDSGLSHGMVVGSDYDPMLAKVIALCRRPAVRAARARPGAGRDRRAGRDHQRRVPAFPAGRRRRGRRSARHRSARPAGHRLPRTASRRRIAGRRGGLRLAERLAGDRSRPVGGAVGLAARRARAGDVPAARRFRGDRKRDRTHRSRTPHRNARRTPRCESKTARRAGSVPNSPTAGWRSPSTGCEPNTWWPPAAGGSGCRRPGAPCRSKRCSRRRCAPTTRTAATPN